MVPRGLPIAIALFLTASAAVPTAVTQGAAAPEFYKVKLVSVTTSYGSENWKLNPGFYSADPFGGLMNGTGQYDGALGHRVTLRVQLTDEEGNPVPTTDADLPFVNMTAHIDTSIGRVGGFILREGAQSTFFQINFDTDGTKQPPGGDAPGEAVPPLLPGIQHVKIDITKGAVRASAIDAGNAELVFDYTNPAVEIEVPDLGTSGYVSDVPDSLFRLFSDIGWGSSVRMVTQSVRSPMNVSATYYFGQANAAVRWCALAAERACQPPDCVFQGPGTIQIHKRLLQTGRTDGSGVVRFSTSASELLSYDTKDYDAAIVVVAAMLDPQETLGMTTLPQEFQQGSPSIRTGAIEFVVPISDASVRVNSFRINTTLSDEAQDGGAPDPIRDAALAANALDVGFFDSGGSSTSGDAIAFVPNARGSAPFHPTPSSIVADPAAAPSTGYRVARLPVLPIQEQHVTWYRVMGVFYGPGQNDFYGLAFADRGYVAEFSAPVAYVGEQGVVYLNLTSVTTNYDLRQQENGFDLRVLLRIDVPDLQINDTQTIHLKEGLAESRAFPISADRPAEIRVDILGTTGDIVSNPSSVNARFVEPPPKKNFVDRIPGFEAVALLMVLGVLVWRAKVKNA